MPVVAVTVIEFLFPAINCVMTVLFPVPALPVRKTFLPRRIVLTAACWLVSSMISVGNSGDSSVMLKSWHVKLQRNRPRAHARRRPKLLIPPDPACWAVNFRYQIHPLVDLMEPCNLSHGHCSGGSSGSSGISGRRPNSGNGKRSNGGFPILEHAIHAVWLECAIMIPRLLCGRRQA